jgi:hypothetical protein
MTCKFIDQFFLGKKSARQKITQPNPVGERGRGEFRRGNRRGCPGQLPVNVRIGKKSARQKIKKLIIKRVDK